MNASKQSRGAVERSLAAEVLESFGEMRFVARGGSMLPSILPGDMLLVRRSPLADLRRGQVVLCRREDGFCAHRVIQKQRCGIRWYVRTSGDALAGEDVPVAEEDVLGQVFAVVRRGKHIALRESRGLGIRVVEWAVRRSDAFATLFLRGHALRVRIAGRLAARRYGAPSGALSGAKSKLTECL